jgi:hypothetical protein
MYLVIDNTCLPCQLRLHYDDGLLRNKKEIESMEAGVHEVIEGMELDTFKKVKLERLVVKAIQVFNPEEIIFKEKK